MCLCCSESLSILEISSLFNCPRQFNCNPEKTIISVRISLCNYAHYIVKCRFSDFLWTKETLVLIYTVKETFVWFKQIFFILFKEIFRCFKRKIFLNERNIQTGFFYAIAWRISIMWIKKIFLWFEKIIYLFHIHDFKDIISFIFPSNGFEPKQFCFKSFKQIISLNGRDYMTSFIKIK